MMNIIKRTILNWLTESDRPYLQKDCVVETPNTPQSQPTLNFSVYNAVGGKVVEFRSYDRKTDQSNSQIYVISKDEDFGKSLAKIATLEMLK